MATDTPNIRPLTPALQEKAIAELNEVPERIASDIAALRDWIAKQPHLKSRTDEQFLVAFLRGSKYSLEKAKKKLNNYYSFRTNWPDLFQAFLDEQQARAIIRLGVGLYLPRPLQEDGPRIMLIRIGHYPTEEHNLYEIMKFSMLFQDIRLITDDNAVVSGYIQLLDFQEFTTTHLLQMNPARMRRLRLYAEETLPIRLRATHFFNIGANFELLFNAIKPILPAKLLDRMHVHTTMDSLYEVVPQRLLPKEYGGENGTIDEIVANAEETIIKYRDYLLEEKNYGTDEELRVGSSTDLDTLFGMDGSFRKLDID